MWSRNDRVWWLGMVHMSWLWEDGPHNWWYCHMGWRDFRKWKKITSFRFRISRLLPWWWSDRRLMEHRILFLSNNHNQPSWLFPVLTTEVKTPDWMLDILFEGWWLHHAVVLQELMKIGNKANSYTEPALLPFSIQLLRNIRLCKSTNLLDLILGSTPRNT